MECIIKSEEHGRGYVKTVDGAEIPFVKGINITLEANEANEATIFVYAPILDIKADGKFEWVFLSGEYTKEQLISLQEKINTMVEKIAKR